MSTSEREHSLADLTPKELFNSDITDLLRDFINNRAQGLREQMYIGKVIDCKDPKKMYRCKVRVYGIYDDVIPDSDIPWALADMNFVGSLVGNVIIPPVDALVRIYFEDGDIYKPVYTSKVFDGNNISEEAKEDYPDTMVLFETDEGEYFKINKKKNITTYHTATGILITIDGKGNILISSESAESKTEGESSGGDSQGGDITIKDFHGNKLEMAKDGVKINGKFLVNEDYLKWMVNNVGAFGIGNLSAPVPINPAIAPILITNTNTPAGFKTDIIPK